MIIVMILSVLIVITMLPDSVRFSALGSQPLDPYPDPYLDPYP